VAKNPCNVGLSARVLSVGDRNLKRTPAIGAPLFDIDGTLLSSIAAAPRRNIFFRI